MISKTVVKTSATVLTIVGTGLLPVSGAIASEQETVQATQQTNPDNAPSQLISTSNSQNLSDYRGKEPIHVESVALNQESLHSPFIDFAHDDINLVTFDLSQSLHEQQLGDGETIAFSTVSLDDNTLRANGGNPVTVALKSLDELDVIANAPDQVAQNPSEDAEAAAQLAAFEVLSQSLYQFHHSPYVFGTLSTVVDDFGSNTQLTGDWGGFRSTLARNGVFFDAYFTTVPQGVVSGGNGGGTSVTQNLDAFLTLNTDLLNLWSGGFFHVTFQSKIGSALNEAGTLSPVNYGSVFPVVDPGDFGLFTEYYWLQALAPNVQMILGKASPSNFGDTNVFANSYRYQFQNASLNNNLMIGSYLPPSTWLAGLVWEPAPWLAISTTVADPNGSAENFADDFFDNFLVTQEYDFSYSIDQKPGNFRLGWIFKNTDSIDFADPLNVTNNGILDFRDPINADSGAFMAYLNFDQYLYLVGENEEDNEEDSSPQRRFSTPRGFGIFGRLGLGPESENFINMFLSLGLGGKGLLGRDYDEFGLGFYHLNFTDETTDLLREIEVLIGGDADFGSESGFEAYYNFAVTPAIQLALDAQYIFDPFLSGEDHAFILGGRVQINF